jgi:ABC-type lipoprotein release transport system permease subunit
MIAIISWKNIWRNKLRSIIVIGSVAMGVMCGTFIMAIMNGMVYERIESAIKNETAHIKISLPAFDKDEEVSKTIDSDSSIIAQLYKMPNIKAVSARTKLTVMASSTKASSGFILNGIDANAEKTVSEIYRFVKDSMGSYFGKPMVNPILISEKTAKDLKFDYYVIDSISLLKLKLQKLPAATLAALQAAKLQKFKSKKLFLDYLYKLLQFDDYYEYKDLILKRTIHIALGKRIEITVRSATGKEMRDVFRVVGIYKTSNGMFDQMNAFALNADLLHLTELRANQCHEIVIMCKNEKSIDSVVANIKKTFPQFTVKTWKQIQPESGMMAGITDLYNIVFMSVILFALGFGIVNTMLMTVFERVKELGMLMAIGMNRRKVYMMLLLETIYLCLTGGFIGMLLGYCIVSATASGISLEMFAEGFEALGYSSVIYPMIDTRFYFEVTILVILTGIIASLYPARKAINLNPAEALHTDI